MLNRFIRDESGVAMGLAVIMIVLIGVMGAGLLVFVRNDLEAVVEVNQGQKAFEIAEAGVQVAKTQQLSDVVRTHYDRVLTNDCDSGQRRTTAEDWSPNTTVYVDPRDCSSGTTTRPTGGVTRSFAGGKFNVTIECFDQLGDPSDICGGITENAPESIDSSKKAFLKITSTGYYPADGNGAKRKIETIYHTNRLDVPTAYYTPKNIRFNGGVSISGVSFFAGGNITKSPSASLSVDRTTPALYRDWDTTNPANFNPPTQLNTVARRKADGTKVEAAGFAALGTVDNFGDGTRGVYDYDSGTLTKFVRKENPYVPPYDPNAPGTISFPFNPDLKFDLETLEAIARSQNNYYTGEVDIDENTLGDNIKYPEGSTDLTVLYVKAGGAKIHYNVAYEDPYPTKKGKGRGLIVVENGNFEVSNSSKGFKGAVIVTGNGTTTGNCKSGTHASSNDGVESGC